MYSITVDTLIIAKCACPGIRPTRRAAPGRRRRSGMARDGAMDQVRGGGGRGLGAVRAAPCGQFVLPLAVEPASLSRNRRRSDGPRRARPARRRLQVALAQWQRPVLPHGHRCE